MGIPGYQCWNLNALRRIVKRHAPEGEDRDQALELIEEIRAACVGLREAYREENEALRRITDRLIEVESKISS